MRRLLCESTHTPPRNIQEPIKNEVAASMLQPLGTPSVPQIPEGPAEACLQMSLLLKRIALRVQGFPNPENSPEVPGPTLVGLADTSPADGGSCPESSL